MTKFCLSSVQESLALSGPPTRPPSSRCGLGPGLVKADQSHTAGLAGQEEAA